MLKRIVVLAGLVLATMIVLKDGRVLDRTGLTGSCALVQVGADGSQLQACREGKLEGRPNLTRQGCKTAGLAGTYEYWRCPASVAAGANGR
jgi:hypothetical protein